MTRRSSPRAVTPRGRRASSATFRRRRIAAAVLAAAVVVVAGQAGVALGGTPLAPERTPTSSSSGSSSSAGSVVVVGPGDTLWSIASRLAPGEDPRPRVDAMSAARDGRALVPGETIRRPHVP
jgi:hypothetical protein